MEKVVLGLSGGVDSAVCARLLQQDGFEVHGLYLDIGSPEARTDAENVADFLHIDLTVQNVSSELEQFVCRPFENGYRNGNTPNPCIICNPSVKFRALLEHAERLGAEKIATGHYARTENGILYRGKPQNDQSYMLCRLTKTQISHLLLPLGTFEKSEVRKLAEVYRIPVAKKPDSMEICFIPDHDYCSWLSRRTALPPAGPILFRDAVIGTHAGIHRWTVGQRLPGLFEGEKLYVKEIRADSNAIVVAHDAELFQTQFSAKAFNWLVDPVPPEIRGSVKVRHTKKEEPFCTAVPLADGTVQFFCDSPVRAPTPGQSAVLYDGERVLGGGFIVPVIQK